MIYPIVVYGEAVLRKQAADVEMGIDIKELIADMHETMQSASGVGLAAPQIGKSIKLFVVDGTTIDEDSTLKGFKKAFINPEIIEESGDDVEYEEGCLSIPHIRENISRPSVLKIRYYDADWNEKEEEYEGFAARIIQHEYDHLEGILFLDHLSAFKRKLLKGKLDDISNGRAHAEYPVRTPGK